MDFPSDPAVRNLRSWCSREQVQSLAGELRRLTAQPKKRKRENEKHKNISLGNSGASLSLTDLMLVT